MPSAIFEFFEAVADELETENSTVLNRANMELDAAHDLLFQNLRDETGSAASEDAVARAVRILTDHFAARGSPLPFSYDESSGRFSAVDTEYLSFIRKMREIRSIGKNRVERRKINSISEEDNREDYPDQHKEK